MMPYVAFIVNNFIHATLGRNATVTECAILQSPRDIKQLFHLCCKFIGIQQCFFGNSQLFLPKDGLRGGSRSIPRPCRRADTRPTQDDRRVLKLEQSSSRVRPVRPNSALFVHREYFLSRDRRQTLDPREESEPIPSKPLHPSLSNCPTRFEFRRPPEDSVLK